MGIPCVFYSHDEGKCLDRIGRSSFIIAMIARGLPIRSALFPEQAHGRGAWQPAGGHHAVPEPVNHALASTCPIFRCCWRRHRERITFSADSWMRSWASKQLVASISQFFGYSLISEEEICKRAVVLAVSGAHHVSEQACG